MKIFTVFQLLLLYGGVIELNVCQCCHQ